MLQKCILRSEERVQNVQGTGGGRVILSDELWKLSLKPQRIARECNVETLHKRRVRDILSVEHPQAGKKSDKVEKVLIHNGKVQSFRTTNRRTGPNNAI